jgi:predicted histidine transporter YuiF (NhaC family)
VKEKKTTAKKKVSVYIIVTFILITASCLALPTTTFLLHIYDPPTTYKDVTVETTEKAEVSGAAEQVFNLHATYHPCTILTTHHAASLPTHHSPQPTHAYFQDVVELVGETTTSTKKQEKDKDKVSIYSIITFLLLAAFCFAPPTTT